MQSVDRIYTSLPIAADDPTDTKRGYRARTRGQAGSVQTSFAQIVAFDPARTPKGFELANRTAAFVFLFNPLYPAQLGFAANRALEQAELARHDRTLSRELLLDEDLFQTTPDGSVQGGSSQFGRLVFVGARMTDLVAWTQMEAKTCLPVIESPGAPPPHLDWVTQILVAVATGRAGDLTLDAFHRLKTLFSSFTQTRCTRNMHFACKFSSTAFGQRKGCPFNDLGCRGPMTHSPATASCGTAIRPRPARNALPRLHRAGVSVLRPEPGNLFKTQMKMGVPKDMPTGVDRVGDDKLTAAASRTTTCTRMATGTSTTTCTAMSRTIP